MYQGFYKLASGMLTQSRNLNVISNNMTNIQTAGYKSDTMVSTTFDEELLRRMANTGDNNPTAMGMISMITSAEQTYTDFEQGSFKATEGIYDFALSGKGFFCVQTADGERYTRNGAFYVDEQGYLSLAEAGRVLSQNGQPILIQNENFTVDQAGTISYNGQVYGQLKIVDFEDYGQLHKEDNGLFSTEQTAVSVFNTANNQTAVVWQSLEESNVDLVEEMTNMMSAQRALQSAAQLLKMYDTIMSKSSTEIGKL